MNSVLSKYAAAILQLTITLVGALVVLRGPLTLAATLQLVPLVLNAFLVYLVPLFGVNMRSGLKTGVAIAVAAASAAVPFATAHHITGGQALVVIFAALQAGAAHLGVQIRNDAAGLLTAATGSDFDDAVTPTAMVKTVTTEDGVEAGAGR